jgi:Dihydrodipicolinate synthetase family
MIPALPWFNRVEESIILIWPLVPLTTRCRRGPHQSHAWRRFNSTREALRLTHFAKAHGADAALIVAPYYNKPTQEGFYQHYKAHAEECGLPICIYNIPGRTAKNIEPDTIIAWPNSP